MDIYLKDIKVLIEDNIVEITKQQISVNNHTLITYFNIGKLLVEAQERTMTLVNQCQCF